MHAACTLHARCMHVHSTCTLQVTRLLGERVYKRAEVTQLAATAEALRVLTAKGGTKEHALLHPRCQPCLLAMRRLLTHVKRGLTVLKCSAAGL